MSREQWGHGFHAGIKEGKKINIAEKHRADCLCITCHNYPCGVHCDKVKCVINCVFYLEEDKQQRRKNKNRRS